MHYSGTERSQRHAKTPSDLPDTQAMPDPARHKRQYRSFTVEAKNAFWRKPMTCLERGELGSLLRCKDI